MSRGITATIQTEVEKPAMSPVFLFEFHFDTGTIRFWTGLGQMTWNTYTWEGSGDVIRFTAIEETAQTRATGVQFQLAGVDVSMLGIALTEDVQGRAVNVWLGFENAGALLADPVGPFEYRMDTLQIDENPNNPIINLTAESYLASLERPRPRRYTHEDQQIEFPGDMGLEFVAAIQQKEITWGRT